MEIGHQRPFLSLCLNRSCGNRSRRICVSGPCVWACVGVCMSVCGCGGVCVRVCMCAGVDLITDGRRLSLSSILKCFANVTQKQIPTFDNQHSKQWVGTGYAWGRFYSKSKERTKPGPEAPPGGLRQPRGTFHLAQTAPRVSVRSLGRKAGVLYHILLRSLLGQCVLKRNKKLHPPSVFGGLGQHPQPHRKLTSQEMAKRLSMGACKLRCQ